MVLTVAAKFSGKMVVTFIRNSMLTHKVAVTFSGTALTVAALCNGNARLGQP